MNDKAQSPNSVEKDRIRSQIEAQVEQFLQRGGQIEVMSNQRGGTEASIGTVWQSLRDELATSVSSDV